VEGNPRDDGARRNRGDVGVAVRAAVPAPRRFASTTVKAAQGGADYTTRFALAERDGGTDLTLTFGAEVNNPSRLSKFMMAVFGPIGLRITRKALSRDLAEIAAKAESL